MVHPENGVSQYFDRLEAYNEHPMFRKRFMFERVWEIYASGI